MARRGYPPEIRRRVLALVERGRKVSEVAAELEISEQTISTTWRRQARIDDGVEPGVTTAEHAELEAARRRIRELEAELAIRRRATELLKEKIDPKTYAAIQMIAAEGLPVEVACRVLGVSTSGYYAWRGRPPSQRAVRHAWVTDVIARIRAESRGTYGLRRVHAELTLGRGIRVGRQAVELLMRRANLQGLSGRPRYRSPTSLLPKTVSSAISQGRSEINSGSPTSLSKRPQRVRCTAQSCSTPSAGVSSAGRSTGSRLRS